MKTIIMPAGGQTTGEFRICEWHKQTGDAVHRGDILFSIETDKAILDVESFCDGILHTITAAEGDSIRTGDPVAYIAEPGEDIPNDQFPSDIDNRIYASPLARKLAKERKISLSSIDPEDGVIKAKHILNFTSESKRPCPAKAFPADNTHYLPHTPMRRAIALKMTESATLIPHYSIQIDTDMLAFLSVRDAMNATLKKESRISVNDMIGKAAALAIETNPVINGIYETDHIRIRERINIGFAVSVAGGLFVPVIQDVRTKTLLQIAEENKENIRLAREGRLTSEKLDGGSITVSNLGMFGVTSFTAIINRPEACILALGCIEDRAVVREGEICARPVMTITASFDHRTVDGAEGAAFLQKLKSLIEQPYLMVL